MPGRIRCQVRPSRTCPLHCTSSILSVTPRQRAGRQFLLRNRSAQALRNCNRSVLGYDEARLDGIFEEGQVRSLVVAFHQDAIPLEMTPSDSFTPVVFRLSCQTVARTSKQQRAYPLSVLGYLSLCKRVS